MTVAGHLTLAVLPTGRHLAFDPGGCAMAHVFRRVGGPAARWTRLAFNARSPYLDADGFAPDTPVEYYVQFTTRYGDEESRSRTVAVGALPPLPDVQAASCR